jgi:siroheme synthase-like protein
MFMRLDGRLCLVVGGGRVAERKVEALLATGACVRVVALDTTEAISEWASSGHLELRKRGVEDDDLDGVFLAIVATGNADVNARLSARCEELRIPVNVVDQPDLCGFIVPATISRGPITIAVSTEGTSPALARHLRELLEGAVGEEYGELAALMGDLRAELRARYASGADRAAAWRRLLDGDALHLLRQGRSDEARALARDQLGLDRPEGYLAEEGA